MANFAFISVLIMFSLNVFYMTKIYKKKGVFFFGKYKHIVVKIVLAILFSLTLLIGFAYIVSMLISYWSHIQEYGIGGSSDSFVGYLAAYKVVVIPLAVFAVLQYNYFKKELA